MQGDEVALRAAFLQEGTQLTVPAGRVTSPDADGTFRDFVIEARRKKVLVPDSAQVTVLADGRAAHFRASYVTSGGPGTYTGVIEREKTGWRLVAFHAGPRIEADAGEILTHLRHAVQQDARPDMGSSGFLAGHWFGTRDANQSVSTATMLLSPHLNGFIERDTSMNSIGRPAHTSIQTDRIGMDLVMDVGVGDKHVQLTLETNTASDSYAMFRNGEDQIEARKAEKGMVLKLKVLGMDETWNMRPAVVLLKTPRP
ncbi:MAG: hypothetical protein JNK04_23495 [Myxococcales bacterium]|nr:hypothetical protein [Myxococcales bacterium]